MEQNMKPSNRHTSIYGILEKVALQICGVNGGLFNK